MKCLRCGVNIPEIIYLESLRYCSKCHEFWLQKAVNKEQALLSFPAEWIETLINPSAGIKKVQSKNNKGE